MRQLEAGNVLAVPGQSLQRAVQVPLRVKLPCDATERQHGCLVQPAVGSCCAEQFTWLV